MCGGGMKRGEGLCPPKHWLGWYMGPHHLAQWQAQGCTPCFWPICVYPQLHSLAKALTSRPRQHFAHVLLQNISAYTSFDLPQAFVLVTYRSLCSRWLFSTTPFMLQKYSWWQASLYSSIANTLNRALHDSEHTHKLWIVHWTHETVSGLLSKLFSL